MNVIADMALNGTGPTASFGVCQIYAKLLQVGPGQGCPISSTSFAQQENDTERSIIDCPAVLVVLGF